MNRREWLGVVAGTLLGGCLGRSPGRKAAEPCDSVATLTPTATGSAALTSGSVVSAEPVRDAAEVERIPPDRRARFRDLCRERRAEFREAVNGSVENPRALGPPLEYDYVRYEGTWYELHHGMA